jgi:chromosome segregation ATPase
MEIKEKLVAELKTKYQGQTTAKFIEGLADRLIVKVEKEEDIQGVIGELDKSAVTVADIQAEGDRRATELTQRIKELEKQVAKTKEKPEPPPPPPDDVSARITNLEKMVADSLKRDERQRAMAAFHDRIDTLKIPRAMIEGVMLEKIDDVDDHVQQVKARYEKLVNEIRGALPEDPPRKGDPAAIKKQVIDDIRRFSKQIK